MKLGTQDVKLFVGATEVSKAYLGTNLIYDSSTTPPEDGVVLGATRFVLPPASFTVEAPNVYIANNTGETALAEKMLGNGMLGMQFQLNSASAFYIASADGSTNYLGFSLTGGVLKYVSNTPAGGATPATQPAVGDFVFLRRIAGNVTLDITKDLGVNWINVVDFGAYSQTSLVTEAYNEKRYVDPQAAGLSL